MMLPLDCPPTPLPLPASLLVQLQIDRPFDLKPVGLRSFTTDISSAVPPGDISMLVGLASMLRQTINTIDWQDDDFVRTMMPAVAAYRPDAAPGINREAARENLLEVRLRPASLGMTLPSFFRSTAARFTTGLRAALYAPPTRYVLPPCWGFCVTLTAARPKLIAWR